MDFTQLEGQIRAIARRYGKDFDDIEELEQIGRLAAWLVAEKMPEAHAGLRRFIHFSLGKL